MEEREENISKNIIEIMDREIKKYHQRERFFRGDHILQIQPSLTSVQEYEELLSRWDRKRLCKVVSSFVKDDPEAADDIVQQALERGFLNLKKGRPCSAPRRILKELKAINDTNQKLDLNQQKILVDNPAAWMYVILRNTGQNYAGKREKERTILMSSLILELEDPRSESRIDVIVEHKERDDQLHRYVADLPKLYSQIIRQHFFEDRKLKDIAHDLGRPESTVRVYLMRGIQWLKEMYAGEREVKNGKMTKKRRQVI